MLIPDIQETAALVQSATYSDPNNKDDHDQSVCNIDYSLGNSIEQKYLEVMKRLQFGKIAEKLSVFDEFNCFELSQTLTK